MSEKIVIDENSGELKEVVRRKSPSTLKKTHIAVYMSEEKKDKIQDYCDRNGKTSAQLGRELFDKVLENDKG